MSGTQLKADFHKLIDSFEDEQILQTVYEILAGYAKQNNQIDIIDDLSESQQKRLEESLKQSKNGTLISNETVKNNLEKWLTK